MAKPLVVIGLGNELRRDDAVGVVLVRMLAESTSPCENVEIVDGGTGGVNLIHRLEGAKRLLIVDAAEMGIEPGQFRFFSPEEVKNAAPAKVSLSLHETDFMGILDILKRLGSQPEVVRIFGIQPKDVSYGIGFSDEIKTALCGLLENLHKGLDEFSK